MVAMKMTALESLMDKNMLYLDITSGVLGLFLAISLKDGLNHYHWYFVLAVIVARLIIDFVYHKFISETDMFGGSNLEFILSSIAWVVLFLIYNYINKEGKTVPMKEIGILYLTTVLSMMAIARATHWG